MLKSLGVVGGLQDFNVMPTNWELVRLGLGGLGTKGLGPRLDIWSVHVQPSLYPTREITRKVTLMDITRCHLRVHYTPQYNSLFLA